MRYQHWMDAMVDLVATGDDDDQELDRTVRQALEKLEEPEKELAERRYLMGQSIAVISEELRRSERDTERGLREVSLKLKRLLKPYVEKRYNTGIIYQRRCSICEFANRECAEEIIAGKQKKETWRRVMRELRQLGLSIDSPQAVIGHVKYHLSFTRPGKTKTNNNQ